MRDPGSSKLSVPVGFRNPRLFLNVCNGGLSLLSPQPSSPFLQPSNEKLSSLSPCQQGLGSGCPLPYWAQNGWGKRPRWFPLFYCIIKKASHSAWGTSRVLMPRPWLVDNFIRACSQTAKTHLWAKDKAPDGETPSHSLQGFFSFPWG